MVSCENKPRGKGTLAREWLSLWGLHGIATDDGDDLFGKYNADMEYKCGVFLDEAFWAGDKKTLGKVKARITNEMGARIFISQRNAMDEGFTRKC